MDRFFLLIIISFLLSSCGTGITSSNDTQPGADQDNINSTELTSSKINQDINSYLIEWIGFFSSALTEEDLNTTLDELLSMISDLPESESKKAHSIAASLCDLFSSLEEDNIQIISSSPHKRQWAFSQSSEDLLRELNELEVQGVRLLAEKYVYGNKPFQSTFDSMTKMEQDKLVQKLEKSKQKNMEQRNKFIYLLYVNVYKTP